MIVLYGKTQAQSGGNGGAPEEVVVKIDESALDIVKSGGTAIAGFDNPAVDIGGLGSTPDATDEAVSKVLHFETEVTGGTIQSVASAVAEIEICEIQAPPAPTKLDKISYMNIMRSSGMVHFDKDLGYASYYSPVDGLIESQVSFRTQMVDVAAYVDFSSSETTVDISGIVGSISTVLGYVLVKSITVELAAVASSGAAVVVEGTIMTGDLIASAVIGVNSDEKDIVTLDYGMTMLSGWIDSTEIYARTRTTTKASPANLYHAIIAGAIFAEISPAYFSANLMNDMMIAVRNGDEYDKPFVMVNNVYLTSPGSPTVSAPQGSGASGSVTADLRDTMLVLNGSGAETNTGRCVVQVTYPVNKITTCSFDIPCGAASGDIIIAGVDAKIAYNHATNYQERGVVADGMFATLKVFHHMIDGFENMLAWSDLASIITALALGVMTRGISCILSNNSISFVFFLIYEYYKLIISDAERNAHIGQIETTVDRMSISMTMAKQGIPRQGRRKMAAQFLETISDEWYEVRKHDNQIILFPLFFLCTYLVFDFVRRMPVYPTPPDYGVPMSEVFLENIEIEDGALTDEILQMMKKNLGWSPMIIRIDQILSPYAKVFSAEAQYMRIREGTTVITKRGGRHQEFYAVEDPLYSIDMTRSNVPSPSIRGEIGRLYKEWAEAVSNANPSRVADKLPGWYGSTAEQKIETAKDVGHNFKYTHFAIIDLDSGTVTIDRKPVSAKIVRPNPNVLLAVKR